MGCKLQELGLSDSEIEQAKEYASLLDMKKKGMPLSVEEQQAMEIMESQAAMGERSLYVERQVRKVDPGKITDMNTQSPRVNNRPVKILEIMIDGEDVRAAVEYKSGNIKEGIKATSVTLNQKNLTKEVLYNEPGTTVGGDYEVLLEKEQMRNVATVKATADTLNEMDDVGVSEEHKAHLHSVLGFVLDPTLKAIPEMAVYLDNKAKRNGGVFVPTEGKEGIYLETGREELEYGNKMSLMETYVHEMVHAATHFGINFGGSRTASAMNKLRELRKQAMGVLTVDDFMPDVVINREVETAIAKERYDYVNDHIEEFLAYALTNQKIFNKIKGLKLDRKPKEQADTYYGKLLALAKTVIDSALMFWRRERKSIKGDNLLYKLSKDIMLANNKANDHIDRSVIDKLSTTIDIAENKWLTMIEKVTDKQLKKALTERPLTKSKVAYAKWIVRNMAVLMFNKDAFPVLQNVMASVGVRQDSVFQTLVRHMKTSDDYSNKLQDLTLVSGQIDRRREMEAAEISNVVSNAFSKKLNIADKKALYVGMYEADGNLLVNEMDNAQELFSDEVTLDKAIVDKQAELDGMMKSKEHKRFINFQVNGLVEYMMTGNGNIAQLRNAETIARLFGTPDIKMEADPVLMKTIDVLVSLKALKKTDSSAKKQIVELMKKDMAGVKSLAKMQEGMVDYLQRKDAPTDRVNRKKGYVRETYDDYVSSSVAPVKDRMKMKAKGYKLVQVLPKSGLQVNEVEMALYTSRDAIRQSINRSSLRFTGDKQSGRSLFENALKGSSATASQAARRDRAKAESKTIEVIDAVIEGKEVDLDSMLTPEFDDMGRIIEYRFNVPLETKLKHLGLETDAIDAVGRTWSHQLDVEESAKLNEVVWGELVKDMAENFRGSKIGKNNYEYIMVSSKSTNKKVADLAKILPKEFKDKLKLMRDIGVDDITDDIARDIIGEAFDTLSNQNKEHIKRYLGRGELWLRKDMTLDALGFRDVSAVDAPMIRLLPAAIKMVLKKAENFWKEVIALYKVDVVIKMLPVIVGNIISNLVYVVQQGGNPIKVAKVQLEAMGSLDSYLRDSRDLLRLKGENMADPKPERLKEIRRLKDDLKINPVAKLMEAGMYQNIIEDVYTDDFKSNSRFANWIGTKTENMPEWAKVAGNWLYVTEKTGLFQMVHRATAKSDFVARYSQFEFARSKFLKRYKREHGKSMPVDEVTKMEKVLLTEIRDTFINYSRPDHATWQYINDMGFFMFTKYAMRIQKIINDGIARHPLRFGMALIGQDIIEGVTGWNPDDAYERSVFVRGPTDLLYSPDISEIASALLVPQMIDNVNQGLL